LANAERQQAAIVNDATIEYAWRVINPSVCWYSFPYRLLPFALSFLLSCFTWMAYSWDGQWTGYTLTTRDEPSNPSTFMAVRDVVIDSVSGIPQSIQFAITKVCYCALFASNCTI
jgi:hypothetical protein